MTKYIVKSCPGLFNDNIVPYSCVREHFNKSCEDVNDCPIKKAVYLVMADNDICKFIGRKEPVLNMQILQTLGVKDVE